MGGDAAASSSSQADGSAPEPAAQPAHAPCRVERRRGEIIAAATGLFTRRGYHRATMQDVADAAGVSVGLLYNYVEDKEETLFLVIEAILSEYLREIPPAIARESDPVARFAAAARAYCQVIGRKPDATVLAYRETKSLGRPRRDLVKRMELDTNALLTVPLQDCIDQGIFRPARPDLAVYRMVMLAHGWALKRWALEPTMTHAEYTEECIDFFLHAMFTEDGLRRYRGSGETLARS